jgi:hypothetical protein
MVTKKRKGLKNWLEEKKKKLRTNLLSDFYTQFKIAVKENNESFFQAFEDFLNTNRKYEDSFVLEKVFKSVQYCGENFLKKIYHPLHKKVIRIDIFNGSIKEYVLLKNMDDTNIQKNAASVPMEKSAFWALWYLLVIDTNRGKEILKCELQENRIYLLHVTTSSGGIFTVRLICKDKNWNYFAREFDCRGGIWGEGSIFLHF